MMYNLALSKQKTIFLLVNLVLGCILIYSYYYYIKYSNVSIRKLWGNSYPYRKTFMVSMIFALISWILIVEFILLAAQNTRLNERIISDLSVIQSVIIIVSMLWLPLTLLYIKSKKNDALTMLPVIVVLFIVAMASLKQILIVRQITYDNCKMAYLSRNLAVIGAIYFFVHTFFVDLVGWNYGFFSQF